MRTRAASEAGLEYLNRIGIALSCEQDINVLLEKILVAAKRLTGADGGTVYLVDPDRGTLRFAIVRTDSLGLRFGGTNAPPPPFPDLPMHRPDGSPNHSHVVTHAALTQHTVNIADAYHEEGFDFAGTREFDRQTGYRSRSFLTVPMVNHEDEVIGVLQLLNALEPDTGRVGAFTRESGQLARSLASQAAVALQNRLLINQLTGLFESFIEMISLAIDEKSPHTGKHCQRVPELTMMIAEAVHQADYGTLADFRMSAADRYELRIAGMLHDCGKVTTPVHVVDKATKLQTIFDRIELLDTRFEVLRRDARIAFLEAVIGGQPDSGAEAALNDTLQRIDADQAFLHQANIGSERMRAAEQQRVRDIAQRHHSRPHGRTDAQPFLNADEIENLCVPAGTLTAAERDVINHHIVATIQMLEALPWPRHLRNVPEYAGGHHERMDGRGYPRGLTREQMSVQARVMGIADIFEALTAADRPYKPAMPLSQSLRILARFSANGHVDPDIFEVFVRSRVWLRFAERHLDPSQIDSVDVDRILHLSRTP